jgi:succinate dehydrogenase / fumarate reductase, cytochrome b subunit
VNEPAIAAPKGTFLERNEFLLRRLHSLSGIVPVGAYMVVHLLTNASVLDGAATFQRRVYAIHSLGPSCLWWSGRLFFCR